MQAVREGGATLLPVDSEHNAVFQCMSGPGATQAGVTRSDVRRVLLTASGGPFLRTPASALVAVTPEQACKHPRWVMGRKISVDSATLMNKGLELIEACLLFALPPAQVEVVVHPQSIVHSLVEYIDGSMLAQLGNPDMRTPIAHALGWPERIASGVESLDILRAARLGLRSARRDPVSLPAAGACGGRGGRYRSGGIERRERSCCRSFLTAPVVIPGDSGSDRARAGASPDAAGEFAR